MNKTGARAWASLSVYESTELVKRFIKERTDKEPDEIKAREIAAHFSQGREYFRSAVGIHRAPSPPSIPSMTWE